MGIHMEKCYKSDMAIFRHHRKFHVMVLKTKHDSFETKINERLSGGGINTNFNREYV